MYGHCDNGGPRRPVASPDEWLPNLQSENQRGRWFPWRWGVRKSTAQPGSSHRTDPDSAQADSALWCRRGGGAGKQILGGGEKKTPRHPPAGGGGGAPSRGGEGRRGA